jgi:hypothetical protein
MELSTINRPAIGDFSFYGNVQNPHLRKSSHPVFSSFGRPVSLQRASGTDEIEPLEAFSAATNDSHLLWSRIHGAAAAAMVFMGADESDRDIHGIYI